jgi:hypothetical protein
MNATVVQLSTSTRCIVAYHRSGKIQHLTFVRGRDAFALNDIEAQKLAVALAEKPETKE